MNGNIEILKSFSSILCYILFISTLNFSFSSIKVDAAEILPHITCDSIENFLNKNKNVVSAGNKNQYNFLFGNYTAFHINKKFVVADISFLDGNKSVKFKNIRGIYFDRSDYITQMNSNNFAVTYSLITEDKDKGFSLRVIKDSSGKVIRIQYRKKLNSIACKI